MLEKMSDRERSLLVLLLGMILIGIIYFGFVKYLYPNYSMVKDELNRKSESLTEINSRISQISIVEEKNSELKNRLQGLTISFNKEVRNGINYYYIGKHAVDNEVMIRELLPEPVEVFDQYLKIPLRITVRGKYRNILRYIEQIENEMPNTSEITLLEIRPAGWGQLIVVREKGTIDEDKKEVMNETEETVGIVKTEAESGKKSTNNPIKDIFVNSISKRLSDASGNTTEGKKGEDAVNLKIFYDVDPDVDVYLTLVTYAIKSPEFLMLAKEKPIGRIDAFSPTIEITVDKHNLPIVDTTEELFPGGTDYPESNPVIAPDRPKDNASNQTEAPKDHEVEKPVPIVPEVIIKETGNYSFPIRGNDGDKGGTKNEH